MRLAAGIDYNDDKLELESNFSVSGQSQSGRSTSAVFAELALPIVGEHQALTGLHNLRVSLAGRYDDYDDFGSTFNPKDRCELGACEPSQRSGYVGHIVQGAAVLSGEPGYSAQSLSSAHSGRSENR